MANALTTTPTWRGIIETGLPALGKRVCLRATSMYGNNLIEHWPSTFTDTDLLKPQQLPPRPWDEEGIVILHHVLHPEDDASQALLRYQDVGHLHFMMKQYSLARRIPLESASGAVQGAAMTVEATVNNGEFVASVFRMKPAPV